jgi:oligopeptide transport system substrate-binding protein
MESRRLVYVLTGIAVSLILVLGVLSLVVLSGGGDDDDDDAVADQNGDSNGEDNGDNGDGSDNEGEGEGPDLGERVEGELRLFGPDPISLDPACASDAGSAEYIVEVFSGLVSFDRDLNVIADIAQDWEVSPDGTVYTFNMRTDVTFHDASRRVTADDFKFSMQRALDPDTQSTVGEVYLDDLVGSDEFIAGNAEEVTGIRVINPETLELTIKEPSAVFLEKLTYPTAYVVDQREVGDSTCFEGNWTLSPNGTGPFRLTEWELGESITLEPHSGFHLEPAPSLQKVTYLLSGGSSFTMYENDEVDITGVGINNIESVLDPSNPLNEEYQQAPALDVFYIGFNVEEPPFDNPDVRRALSMAIDKQFLAEEFLEGLVVPANGIVPPGMPGYNENLQGIEFDPEGARELLDETGLAGELEGKSVLTSGVGAAPSDILQAVIAMWEENLGVALEVEQEDQGLFFQDIEEGNYEMTSVGWIADYPDPQNFLDIKLHSESPNNDNFYGNPEVDALLDEARSLDDEAARLELYQQAEQLIVDDAPWIPLYHGRASFLVKPYVEGYEQPPFVIPNLRYVTINN